MVPEHHCKLKKRFQQQKIRLTRRLTSPIQTAFARPFRGCGTIGGLRSTFLTQRGGQYPAGATATGPLELCSVPVQCRLTTIFTEVAFSALQTVSSFPTLFGARPQQRTDAVHQSIAWTLSFFGKPRNRTRTWHQRSRQAPHVRLVVDSLRTKSVGFRGRLACCFGRF